MSAFHRWEYAIAAKAEELNALGAEGWELVGVTAQPGGGERFYLKRPLPSLREQITLEQRKHALDAASEGGSGG
ncbi:hypothetical protein [Paenibacillus flagellatus]|uniref:hypothetical protein n=1 Tax=Paenibacillus flagellatus TaxID=2211139 RepID=UPI003CCC6B16